MKKIVIFLLFLFPTVSSADALNDFVAIMMMEQLKGRMELYLQTDLMKESQSVPYPANEYMTVTGVDSNSRLNLLEFTFNLETLPSQLQGMEWWEERMIIRNDAGKFFRENYCKRGYDLLLNTKWGHSGRIYFHFQYDGNHYQTVLFNENSCKSNVVEVVNFDREAANNALEQAKNEYPMVLINDESHTLVAISHTLTETEWTTVARYDKLPENYTMKWYNKKTEEDFAGMCVESPKMYEIEFMEAGGTLKWVDLKADGSELATNYFDILSCDPYLPYSKI